MPKSLETSNLTVRQFLTQLWSHSPNAGQELFWPPNMFAFSSAVFMATGCYRTIVAQSTVQARALNRQDELETNAVDWIAWLSERLEGKNRSTSNALSDAATENRIESLLKRAKRVRMSELRVHEATTAVTSDAAQFVLELMDLHAIADIGCAQFGLLGGGSRKSCVAKCLAELMLTAMGTMSTMPKHFGVVVPKMRTPQSGLSVRSLSHHLAFSPTEVEIAWRCFPWLNDHEDSVNALLLPWPMVVSDMQFTTSPDSLEVVRYFDYGPPSPSDMVGRSARTHEQPVSIVSEILNRVENAMKTVPRLHMIVLPELALSRADFDELLRQLAEIPAKNCRAQLPLIVSGVSSHDVESDGKRGRKHSKAGTSTPVNEVQLAAYFAGRWYRLSQRKHHRWKLDRNQIMQYGLQARLGTMRGTLERMAIAQRRLGIFAPTGWMAMCPLICEDLAQLEPVSEVIRAIGPTFLIALLLDGPQLRERWSARYASVLADDPGTTVLTLTAAGMVARSSPLQNFASKNSTLPGDSETDLCVGLWRDAIDGWREIRLPDGDDAILLSMSAAFSEEYTADGRSDGGAAAQIRFDGYRTFRGGAGSRAQSTSRPPAVIRRWDDLRELASATHALDATLYLGIDATKHVRTLVKGFPKGTDAASEHVEHLPNFLQRCVTALWAAQRDPRANGTNAGDAIGQIWESRELNAALDAVDRITGELADANVYDTDSTGRSDELGVAIKLAETAMQRLEDSSGSFTPNEAGADEYWATHVALPTMLLTLIHARLQRYRGHREGRSAASSDSAHTRSVVDVTTLVRRIESTLRNFS